MTHPLRLTPPVAVKSAAAGAVASGAGAPGTGAMGALAIAALVLIAAMAGCASAAPSQVAAVPPLHRPCGAEIIVLGVAQDGGMPQIGHSEDAAWADPSLRRMVSSVALIDHTRGLRFVFDATPDLSGQLRLMDQRLETLGPGLRLDGVFLTHAHIGHYAGLMLLGREAAGARDIPVWAMPRMRGFLEGNGPWDQLVRLGNIQLRDLAAGQRVDLGGGLTVTPLLVPHRDEYSETVGFVIAGPDGRVLYLPDIDSWDRWRDEYGVEIADLIQTLDAAYIDATFFDDHELGGRDMSQIPHPRVVQSMDLFSGLPTAERGRVRFIHLNHSNRARFPGSEQESEIERRGFRLAREGETVCLNALP